MLVDSLAVIGVSEGVDLKRTGTELTIASSQDQVIRYSVGPVPWREEN